MVPAADAPPSVAIQRLFGDIDIYLFDQLARGRFDTRRRVVDVGCGTGRNLRYLIRMASTAQESIGTRLRSTGCVVTRRPWA